MIEKLILSIIYRSDFFYGLLRRWWPIAYISIGKKKIAVVSRSDNVREVLQAKNTFRVPYESKVRAVLGGENFFLAMDDDPEHADDKALLFEIMPPSEAAARTKPEVERLADEVLAKAEGRVDVVVELIQYVTTRFFGDYFGLPGPVDLNLYSDWARTLFKFLSIDQGKDMELRRQVDDISGKLSQYIDDAIAEEKSNPTDGDNLLSRCLRAQADGKPLTNLKIRNSLLGLIVASFPQAPTIFPQLLDVLLDRPQELARACAAARENDHELLSKYAFEALRFYPPTPWLFRNCAETHVVAQGTARQKRIPAGTTVFALTRSAMFDGKIVSRPHQFQIDRPETDYLHFGFGPHECFGRYMNKVMIPSLCNVLLKLPNLRRASGPAGKLQMDGTFAKSLVVEFND